MKKILCIGECMLELQLGQLQSLPQASTLAYAGDVFNVAWYMQQQLAPQRVAFFSAVGDDAISDRLLESWQAVSIDCDQVQRLPGKLPGLYMIENDASGERYFHYYRSQSAAREMLAAYSVDALQQCLQSYSVVYLSGITVAILPASAREILWQALMAAGVTIAFDLNYRPKLWQTKAEAEQSLNAFIAAADVVLPTLDDCELLYDKDGVASVLANFQSVTDAKIILKNGADGCYVCHESKQVHYPTTPVKNIVDTTSAGDAFNAGFLAATLQGKPEGEAIAVAQSLAGKVVQFAGALNIAN